MAAITKPFICPQDYGAAYNGSTDDSSAVEAAINYVSKNAGTYVYFPPGAGCAVSRTIVVPPNVKFIMDAPITYIGNADVTALQIGNASAISLMQEYKLNVKRKTISKWSSEQSIGIKLINLEACTVAITTANGFTIGVQALSDGKGFVFNLFQLGELLNNKIGLDCANVRSGWFNENLLLNGQFTQWSSTNTGLSRYGIRITSQDGSYANNNNNYFIKPSFELGKQFIGSNEAIPIVIEYGQQNEFISCRNESNSDTFARILNQSSENAFDVGYGDLPITSIDDRSAYPLSYVCDRRHLYSRVAGTLIFESGPMHERACYYDGSANVNVPNVNIANSSATTVSKFGPMTIAANYLELAKSSVGIFIDTHLHKRFLLKKDVEPGYGGRVAVICYDANGNVIAGSSNNAYVKGSALSSPYYSTQLLGGGSKGGYLTGSDSEDDYYFTVSDEVQSIRVLLGPGSKSLRVRSFSLFGLDGYSSSWTGYEEIVPGVNLGITPPTAGSWGKGRLVLNDNKTELGNAGSKYVIEGWECIAAPNTWVQKRMLTGR